MKRKNIIIGVSILLLIIVIGLIEGQLEDQFSSKDDEIINRCTLTNVSAERLVLNRVLMEGKNSSGENYSYYQIVNYSNETYYKTTRDCVKEIDLKDKSLNLDYQMQGFNCSTTTEKGFIFMCDSCIDGDCKGDCSGGGGETCCGVTDEYRIICKNGVTVWGKGTHYIQVKELELR